MCEWLCGTLCMCDSGMWTLSVFVTVIVWVCDYMYALQGGFGHVGVSGFAGY